MTKINVAIAGGTGYTAGELMRVLIHHPKVNLVAVLSSSLAGNPVSSVHRDLIGETSLSFSSSLEGVVSPDLLFLALGHGLSHSYLNSLDLPKECKIIDLSNDFRLSGAFREVPFIYGLPEYSGQEIATAHHVANPGCFATAILLSLLPLAKEGLLTNEVHIHGITGSTGAGKSLTESSHFSYRHSNLSAYKVFTHQHLEEIKMTINRVTKSEDECKINFVPIRGGFSRGIFISGYSALEREVELSFLENLYNSYYSNSPFVWYSSTPPSLKEVINSNKALIHLERHGEYTYFTTVIDNLLKGAAGQAIQNMNLMFDFDQKCGLTLKGSAF